MYGYDNPSLSEIRTAMTRLTDLGVATVNIEFSGGNDEGGVDSIEYLDANGAKVEVPSVSAYQDREWNPATRTYGPAKWTVHVGPAWNDRRPATAEEISIAEVGQVLECPVYDRYGSFAGEFYVNGRVTWDVAAGTHKMTGQESHEVWEDI